MSWLGDRLGENNSKLAFGVIAGGAIYVLNNPAALQSQGMAFWGPVLAGVLSQIVHILLPAVPSMPTPTVAGIPAALPLPPGRGGKTSETPEPSPEQGN